MSQPPQATRRGGWGTLICALLILAVVGVAAAWLRYTGTLAPLLSATPRAEISLPPPDEIPLETVELVATTAPETEKTEPQLPVAAVEPPAALNEPVQEPVVIPAAPALPVTEQTSAEVAEPPPALESAVEQAQAGQADREPQVATTHLPGAAPASTALPAWRRFARPFDADDTRPRIAVIVAELGLSERATRTAIQRLPADVTLSFSPYARNLQEWIDTARADGHEVLLDLPMEPVSFPRDDPGPKALLTSLSAAENRTRLAEVLDQAEGYIGVVPWMGSRFTASADDLRPILRSLGERGLMFVDPRVAPDSIAARLAREAEVPRAINDRFLDHEASRTAIGSRLMQIEHQARTAGFAVGMASPYPITIEHLDQWVRTLDRKGLALAPVSALADQQEEQ